jgi:hypothetical protein
MTPGCGNPGCPCLADWAGILLFDAGYWTEDNLTAPGPDRLIAPGKNRDLPGPIQLSRRHLKQKPTARHQQHRTPASPRTLGQQ